MIAVAMIALLVAAAPVQEELENLNDIEIALTEEDSEDENADLALEEIVFGDEVETTEDLVPFDEEE